MTQILDTSLKAGPGGRPGQRTPGHHLKLVQYLPSGGEPHVCAAIWREGDHVHLVSPLLRTQRGVRDPRPYARQFPEGLALIDAFEDTMTWLDAACYAAADTREVEEACRQHPEWQLRCIRYDGSDATLLGLTGLIRAAERVEPLSEVVMRDCLLELVKQVLKNDVTLVDAQIDTELRADGDVATVDIGMDCRVLITLLKNVASTDVVRQGLLAHYRITAGHKCGVQCLLVLPDLDLERPIFISSRVVITNMNPDHVRASLVRMAGR